MKKDTNEKQIIGFHEVRSAMTTATASLTSGAGVSLITGDTDYFLDILEMTCANNSATVNVLLKSDGTTVRTLQLPANTTKQYKFDVPLKQETKETPWVVEMEDITGTTVTIDAHLIKKN